MSNVIEFNEAKGREGLKQMNATAINASEHLSMLSRAIDSAQQSFKSMQLLQNGYCGNGIKREISNANELPRHLANAGSVVQSMIIEAAL